MFWQRVFDEDADPSVTLSTAFWAVLGQYYNLSLINAYQVQTVDPSGLHLVDRAYLRKGKWMLE